MGVGGRLFSRFEVFSDELKKKQRRQGRRVRTKGAEGGKVEGRGCLKGPEGGSSKVEGAGRGGEVAPTTLGGRKRPKVNAVPEVCSYLDVGGQDANKETRTLIRSWKTGREPNEGGREGGSE